MKKHFLALGAIAMFGYASPAGARPWIYMSTWSHGGSSHKCLNQAKAALEAEGFTKELAISYHKDKASGGVVEGVLPDSPVRAKIDCNPRDGITGLAVSGLDNQLTYDKYNKLFKSTW